MRHFNMSDEPLPPPSPPPSPPKQKGGFIRHEDLPKAIAALEALEEEERRKRPKPDTRVAEALAAALGEWAKKMREEDERVREWMAEEIPKIKAKPKEERTENERILLAVETLKEKRRKR